MLNGLLCPVRPAPAEQIVDTDLRTLLGEHIENLLINSEAKEKLSIVALVFCRIRQWQLFGQDRI